MKISKFKDQLFIIAVGVLLLIVWMALEIYIGKTQDMFYATVLNACFFIVFMLLPIMIAAKFRDKIANLKGLKYLVYVICSHALLVALIFLSMKFSVLAEFIRHVRLGRSGGVEAAVVLLFVPATLSLLPCYFAINETEQADIEIKLKAIAIFILNFIVTLIYAFYIDYLVRNGILNFS
ncbi:hypothetical protein [Campylobacter sp.]|uniref:hypothetical protein n=1 Tax=Campylobacter sp. TaxID=205 RepID=UPI0026F5E2C9|nr:hypothetical protein [Campylobacter sp.]